METFSCLLKQFLIFTMYHRSNSKRDRVRREQVSRTGLVFTSYYNDEHNCRIKDKWRFSCRKVSPNEISMVSDLFVEIRK